MRLYYGINRAWVGYSAFPEICTAAKSPVSWGMGDAGNAELDTGKKAATLQYRLFCI